MEEKKNRASRDSMGGGGMGGFSDRPPMGRGERGSQVRTFVFFLDRDPGGKKNRKNARKLVNNCT